MESEGISSKDFTRNRKNQEEASNWSDTTYCSDTESYSDSNTIIYSYHPSDISDNEGDGEDSGKRNGDSGPEILSVLQLEGKSSFGRQDDAHSPEKVDSLSPTNDEGTAHEREQQLTKVNEEQFRKFLNFDGRSQGTGNSGGPKRNGKISIVPKYFQLPQPCAAYDGSSSVTEIKPVLLNSKECALRLELAALGRTEDCHVYRAECNMCADKLKYCPRSLTDELLMHLMFVHNVKGSKVYISQEDEDKMKRLFANPSYSSVVWNYFILRHNSTATECMLCGEMLDYPLDMSTASMRSHLTNEHSVILSFAQWDD